MRIFDTHAHYDDEAFDTDRDRLLDIDLAAEGVEYVVNVGASMKGAEASAAFARKYASESAPVKVLAGIGIHPDDTGIFEGRDASSSLQGSHPDDTSPCERKEAPFGLRFSHPDDVMQHLRDLCAGEGVVCIGEIGLDYHWMVEAKEVQQHWFREQMRLAHELHLPINVHSRDAAKDTFDLIRENYEAGLYTGGIIHCFSGSLELAREYVKMGYHIGIGGVVTFKNGKTLKKVAAEIPLEFLVTETDCPYLAPEPYRGKRNDSRYIRYVIEAIAALKEMDPEACAQALFQNACRVYRIRN